MTTSATITNSAHDTTEPNTLSRIFTFDRFTVSVSALALTVGAIPIASLLDWPTWIVLAVGVGLIPYAWMLHTVVRNKAFATAPARLSAVADALWVLASVAVIVLVDRTSTIGTWLVAAQALMVADIGLIKVVGWRRS
ncbi:MAG: hypothetical protein OEZ14_16195 [Acidimicrobiia bacterium]|nr:hypothetical protein [Acidimicrobiia bacterium]MDH5522062.1 hypothetical protein [Acidimicrobiia bacterium]